MTVFHRQLQLVFYLGKSVAFAARNKPHKNKTWSNWYCLSYVILNKMAYRRGLLWTVGMFHLTIHAVLLSVTSMSAQAQMPCNHLAKGQAEWNTEWLTTDLLSDFVYPAYFSRLLQVRPGPQKASREKPLGLLIFLQARCPSRSPTNSVKALNGQNTTWLIF